MPNRTAVLELLELAAAPVLEAMPERDPVDRLYNPEVTDEEIRVHGTVSDDPADLVAEVERHAAWAAALEGTPFGDDGELTEVGYEVVSLILRGSVRAAVSGVFEDGPETADIRCYADGEHALVMASLPDRTAIHLDDYARLPELVVGSLPDAPEGEFRQIWLSVDEHGLIHGQHEEVGALRELLARPRSGTAVLDVFAFGGLCAEFPEHGFVLLDTDVGRHVLCAIHRGGGQRQLVLAPFSRDMLIGWFREVVDAGPVEPS
ncbi:ESX secretion-associated protein EspG [Amycolatopsis sp. NPDC059027]|uniref:ESX secretion-associated protein EspG n=1 Tax=unclassified Amycolatopsis TaxID=2618356 RepID=UPI003673450E